MLTSVYMSFVIISQTYLHMLVELLVCDVQKSVLCCQCFFDKDDSE